MQDLDDAVERLTPGGAYEAMRRVLVEHGPDATPEVRLRIVRRIAAWWPSSVFSDAYAGVLCRRECAKHGIEIAWAWQAQDWLRGDQGHRPP